MKKICFMFNHFQHMDGVSRSALAYANYLAENRIATVTLIPLFKDEKEFHNLLHPEVKINPVFGFYFKGMSKIVKHIPFSWINYVAIKDDYDIMVGFQEEIPIKCIAASHRSSHAIKFAWLHCYFDWLLPALREDYEKIGKVICVSRCNADKLRIDLPTIETDYCYNPIDEIKVIKSGNQVLDRERPTDRVLFVSVARMSPEKGYIRLLNILSRLKREGWRFMFWLIGDGPQLQELTKLAVGLDLKDSVEFLGRQNNPHKYTSKADVFVCSSFVEGYSTACTEAIMLGVPVITTNVSGAEEIIEDAECGMITEMNDESLYKALREVLQNPSIVTAWKKKLEITKEKFYKENRIKRLLNIFGIKDC